MSESETLGVERDSRLQLTVSSAVADSVIELISGRFDNVTTRAAPGPATVLTITGIDQAGERALLNLLWDTGHEIAAMTSFVPQVGPPALPPD